MGASSDGSGLDSGRGPDTRVVLEALPTAAVVIDATGQIVQVNQLAEQMFQYSRNELEGQPVDVLLPERLRTPDLASHIAGLIGHWPHLITRRRDGREIVVQAHLRPLRQGPRRLTLATVAEVGEGAATLTDGIDDLFRTLVYSNVNYAVFVLDLAGRVQTWNRGAERLCGLGAAEIIGQHVSRLFSREEADADQPERLLAQARAEGSYSGQHWWIGRDDRRVWVDVSITLLRSRSNRPRGLGVIAHDASRLRHALDERDALSRQLEAERSWSRVLVERSPVGIILTNGATGESIRANRRAEVLFGHPLPAENGIAQLVEHVCRPDGSPCPIEEMPTARALHGQVINGEELVLRRLDGREIPVLIHAGPIQDPTGRVIGAITIVDDVSPIKELERLRMEWTSIIAHDLRQPTTVILGYAGQLARRDDLLAAAGGALERPIQHILSSARQLSRMINDLLDVSRLEARRLALDPRSVDLVPLITAVVDRTVELTRGHPVRILQRDGQSPIVRADPSRLEQVLTNLLSNAAKYSYPGSEIRLEVQRRAGEVVVSVANDGEGIAAEDLPRLFTRFHRPRRAREAGISGLGLGLYITRGLVEAHGGRIWAESVPGDTTTFFFTLPEDGAVG